MLNFNFRRRLLPIFAAIVLVWFFFYYSFSLVSRLREAKARANETIAWFWAGAQVPMSMLSELGIMYVCSECGSTSPAYGAQPPEDISVYCNTCQMITSWHLVTIEGYEERELLLRRISRLFNELVDRLDYTTVLSDTHMMPQVVDGVAVSDSLAEDSLKILITITKQLDRENDPVPITGTHGEIVGYLHYGYDAVERELMLVPYIEMGIVAVLVLLFFYIIRSEMKKEKELSWIGFAKETAHQISTPLSSLMGWVEILRERPGADDDSEVAEALEFMEKDLERLRQIASRYGQMGKKPKMEIMGVNPVILEVVHYFSGRPGFLPDDLELETSLRSTYKVELNPVLISWVIENLMKNSIAAMSSKSDGTITLASRDLEEGAGIVEVEVSDSGAGIPFRNQKKVFMAGFSTRRGGWGLGLTLSRRIIEKYHGGIMRLKASSPGKGTTFTIRLPRAERDEE